MVPDSISRKILRRTEASSSRLTWLLRKLQAHVERIVLGAIVEEEGLGPRRGLGFFLARAASFIARETAMGDALHHFVHLLFVGLASDLEQQRFREDAAVRRRLCGLRSGITCSDMVSVTDGARAADFLGDVVVRVIEMIGEALQAVGFFEGRQVFALKIFDQRRVREFRRRRRFSRCRAARAGRRPCEAW